MHTRQRGDNLGALELHEISRIRGCAVKSDVYMNVHESGRLACRIAEVTRSSDAQGRYTHTYTHSLSFLAAVFLHVSSLVFPSPPPPLFPPTRRVVSHALYLEARRARIPRSYALSRVSLGHRKNMSRSSLYPRRGRRMMCFLSSWTAMCGPP